MHGILDGISSLHSWMKNQATTATSVGNRAALRGARGGLPRERVQTYDEVFIVLWNSNEKKMCRKYFL